MDPSILSGIYGQGLLGSYISLCGLLVLCVEDLSEAQGRMGTRSKSGTSRSDLQSP